MGHNTIFKKCRGAAIGSVNKLINDHHMTRFYFLFQTSHSTDGQNSPDTQLFHPINISPIIDLGGIDVMTASMAGQKYNLMPLKDPDRVFVRRPTKGGLDLHLFFPLQPLYLIQPAPPNHPKVSIFHIEIHFFLVTSQKGPEVTPICK